MSNDPISNEEVKNEQPEVQEAKEQFVNRKAYEEVSKDMHKFKSKAKELEAAKNEYEARLKAIEEAKLVEEKRYQELYENAKKEAEAAKVERENDKNLYLKSVKLNALKTEIGDINDAYLSFADLDSIEVGDDGSLSSESVLKVANEFRQNHPSLIPSNSNSGITSMASPTGNTVQKEEKDLSQLTFEEKAALLKQLKNK